MNRSLGLLVVLSFVAAACGTSVDTDVPAADGSGVPAATTAGTVAAEPAVPAAIEPVTDRLPADSESPMDEWVAGVNAAGWDFHRHLDGNAVSSPLSIGVAFSLSRAGASTDTAAVLDEIFGFPEQGSHSAANAVDLLLAQASAEPNIVEVANRLFPDDGFSPRPEFLETAAAHYGATIQPVDTADGDAAAGVINDWVSGRTRGLIPVIVDEKGTEAAAATSMGFNESMPPPPDLTIVADRPFLWAIIHNDTQALLFVGRLTNPA